MIAWILAALAAGSGVYCILVVCAAWAYRRSALRPLPEPATPLSVLKPLHGLDEGLEENLRPLFEQDYLHYELLFAVRFGNDPSVAVVQKLTAAYPHVHSRLIVVGEPPYPNAKVWSLQRMTDLAQHEVLVMSDSDIRVGRDFLRAVAAEFHDDTLGVATCPYRAVAGRSMASTLEAIGMNTEFLGGVLVARLLEGMKFALGPTLSARKKVIDDVGGWPLLAEYLAEDFVLGNQAAAKGWRVILSSYVVEHRIGSQPWAANARHRLRWFRSTRRSRPAGYVGQLFTNPFPLLVAAWMARPEWWTLAVGILFLRVAAAAATAHYVLRDKITLRMWLLLPVQDLLSFAFWIAGFFGNTIQWRGRSYLLLADGRFQLK